MSGPNGTGRVAFAWMCSLESHQPEVAIEHAVLAERAGFDAVFVPDVFHPLVDPGGTAGFAWAWLGAAASRTERITLATTVTCPLFRYHPALVAQAAATVDRLSGGRFILGVGTGDAINDVPLTGPVPPYRERAALLREAVALMRRLWAGEVVTTVDGAYPVDGARLASPPLSGPRLWMAAAGPASATMAGELGDGVITSVKDPETAARQVVSPFRTAAAHRGRAGTVVATRWCVLASDPARAREALGPMRGLRVPARARTVDPTELRREADATATEDLMARFSVASGPEDLVQAYRPLIEDLRADVVSIQVASTDPIAAIRLVGQEVIPALRSLG